MGTRKIGPAVAAGCTMVVKPAELTPLTMLALAAVLAEAGLPGRRAQRRHHQRLQGAQRGADGRRPAAQGELHRLHRRSARCWSGSPPTQLQRVSMELGGNAPFLVFEDADVDAAVDGAMIAKMRNMGEACTAANRFLVHESVAEEFADKLGERMGALTLGRGQDDGVDVGPLIDAERRRVGRPAGHRRRPRRRRRWSSAARPPTGPGYFYPPTVLLDVPGRVARSTARRSSARSRRSPRSPPRTRRSRGPTPPSTAWRPTSTPATSPARSGWPRRWSSAWSASTPAWSPTRRRRSAA